MLICTYIFRDWLVMIAQVSRAQFYHMGALIVILMLSVSMTGHKHAHAADLTEFLYSALKRNPALQKTMQQIDSRAYARRISKAGLLPQLSLDANTSLSSSTTYGRGENADTRDSFPEAGDSISLSQVLFDPQTYYSYKNAQISLSRQELQYKKDYQATLNNTLNAYFEYLRSATQLRTTKMELQSSRKRLQQIMRSYELGNVAKVDVLESQANLDNILASEVTQENALKSALIRLQELSLLFEKPTSDILSVEHIVGIDKANFDNWHDIAEAQNPDVLIAQKDVQSAQLDLKSSQSEYYPTVNLNASHSGSDSRAAGANNATRNGRTQNQSVTLNLRLPLYSGGSREYGVKQAQKDVQISNTDFIDVLNSTIADLDTAIENINANARSIEILQRSIQANHESYEAIQTGYKLGERKLTDVLDAQSKLYNVIRDYYGARYDYIINTSDFHRISGTLSLDVISEITANMVPIVIGEAFDIPIFEEDRGL